ncbi:MAG: hypothetical protein R3293_14965 [Candidatus Promineifilaceae bacterium]|nr:hypothetical protein [Candidatus Promineifilaceae bacterium]
MVEKIEDIVPRAEFRAFAVDFGRVVDEIRRRAACSGIKESRELYLVSAANDKNNIKIRHNQLDIKQLLGIEQGLERWRPVLKMDFPSPAGEWWAQIFSALNVSVPAAAEGEITIETFVDEVLWPHAGIRVAEVFKRRFFFSLQECKVEITELMINRAAIQTVAVEHVDTAAVLAVQEEVGLSAYENVNYVLALQRIMSLAPLPSPHWHMEQGGNNG